MSAREESSPNKTRDQSNPLDKDGNTLQRSSLTRAATTSTTNPNDLEAKESSPSQRRGTAVPLPSDIVDLTLSVVGDDTQGHEDVTGKDVGYNRVEATRLYFHKLKNPVYYHMHDRIFRRRAGASAWHFTSAGGAGR